jgi:carbonic anhydrase
VSQRTAPTRSPEDRDPAVTPGEALRRLIDGNARFLRGESRFTGMRPEMLADLAEGQHPFATVLGCADARVVPELIFDAVLGELFVVRVAGNLLSAEGAGSFQFAAAHLGTRLFVVLGHEGCGAVKAALETRLHHVVQRSRIQILVDDIAPALEGVDPALPMKAQLAHAVEANVRFTVRRIREMPEARAAIAAGELELVGAVYDLESGRVRFLEPA